MIALKNIQIIEKDGEPEFAVVPYDDLQNLIEHVETLSDINEANIISGRISEGEETYSVEVVKRVIKGDNPIKVFREYRGIKQKDLANKLGISIPYLSQLETNPDKSASIDVYKGLSAALMVDIDDLV